MGVRDREFDSLHLNFRFNFGVAEKTLMLLRHEKSKREKGCDQLREGVRHDDSRVVLQCALRDAPKEPVVPAAFFMQERNV